MKTASRIVAAAAALVLLAACGGPDNTDPRKGRVTTYESNCLTGSCEWDWKVCLGPDLMFHVNGDNHTLKGSPECVR